jgi:hypothetical protein
MPPLIALLLIAAVGMALPSVGYWVVDQFYRGRR